MQPTIAFRVDWSRQRGLGHLQRCLYLADALTDHGVSSALVARQELAAATSVIPDVDIRWLHLTPRGQHAQVSTHSGDRPYETTWTQEDDAHRSIEAIQELGAHAVVVDRYKLDADWESRVRDGLGLPVVAIDGLADRRHAAELVVDPTYVADDRTRWHGLLGVGTRVLRGPRYALISPRFQEGLRQRPSRHGIVRRVLISFGGSDPEGLTECALDAMEMVKDLDLALDVVVGAAHAAPERVRERCAKLPNAAFHHATSQMAELMAAADLAVGSGGITTYERAFLGLPALVVVAADNQVTQIAEVARAGAVVSLGTAANVTASMLASALRDIATDQASVRRMSAAAREILGNDTVPGSLRVAEEVVKLL